MEEFFTRLTANPQEWVVAGVIILGVVLFEAGPKILNLIQKSKENPKKPS